MSAYHDGQRALQDRHDSRRLADRLEELTYHEALTDEERAFIERAPFFFLATADEAGLPDVSYKGGAPGFVRCVDDRTLRFDAYDGNGQFRSLGNVLVNPQVSLLFVDFASPNRLRLQGRAALGEGLATMSSTLPVRVELTRVWPNCPRYVHKMELVELSPNAPREGHVPPDAEWKQWFTGDLPRPA